MAIQSSTQIGEIIRNAVAFNIKNWPGGEMNLDSLTQSVQDLFALLEEQQIEYVLVGGIALLYYIEGRNTQDLDLLMALSSLEKIPGLVILHQDKFFARAKYGELQIDVLLTRNPLFNDVYRHYASRQQFLDRSIVLANVEGLILLKLYALPSLYRQGNFARVGLYENDIATLMHAYQPDMAALLQKLAAYVDAGDATEIQGIVADIQNRIRRFKSTRGQS